MSGFAPPPSDKIIGHRDLTPDEVSRVNNVKQKYIELAALLDEVSKLEFIDKRCISIAKTEAESSSHWATKAIAKPTRL